MTSAKAGKGYKVLCRDWRALSTTFKEPSAALHPIQHGTYCDGPHSRIKWNQEAE